MFLDVKIIMLISLMLDSRMINHYAYKVSSSFNKFSNFYKAFSHKKCYFSLKSIKNRLSCCTIKSSSIFMKLCIIMYNINIHIDEFFQNNWGRFCWVINKYLILMLKAKKMLTWVDEVQLLIFLWIFRITQWYIYHSNHEIQACSTIFLSF